MVAMVAVLFPIPYWTWEDGRPQRGKPGGLAGQVAAEAARLCLEIRMYLKIKKRPKGGPIYFFRLSSYLDFARCSWPSACHPKVPYCTLAYWQVRYYSCLYGRQSGTFITSLATLNYPLQ